MCCGSLMSVEGSEGKGRERPAPRQFEDQGQGLSCRSGCEVEGAMTLRRIP